MPPATSTSIRAAQYVRMSTEHQQYSTENQSAVLAEYAGRHNMTIVRTFTDAGKSGLRLDGREALKELIQVVQSGKADFEVILVYDVSRWGRFQDADESGHYEYLCRRAGIRVLYCAEQFENDGTPVSNLFKGVKRMMAGEYSRELSVKVFRGQCRLIELGFRQGGTAGYGLRRMLIDHTGKPKGLLARGEHKSIQTDRVVLTPGPADELTVVRRIYRLFIEERRTEREIAAALNRDGIPGECGRLWTRSTVHEVLTNEKYLGNNIYNRVSFKLKTQRVRNPPEQWIRHDGAFEAIVDPTDFFTAREIILERDRRLSDDELLARLKALAEQIGRLSGVLINEADGMPSSSVYSHRFGSLVRAYELIGYSSGRDYSYVEINRRLRRMHPEIVESTVAAIERVGGAVLRDEATGLITVNRIFAVSIVISRCSRTAGGAYRWMVRFDTGLKPDLTVVVRMNSTNEAALDYYLFPSLGVRDDEVRIRDDNGIYLDMFRFDSLDYLYSMAELVPIEEAAS
ncbi:MAG TPA: recombinase family protein [Kofleriaceae bacterium]|nr:recombinase family protein [Kofleriaceae bacterium]